MSTLEFENTQGIMLKYGTASVLNRAVSFLIDAIVLTAFVVVLYLTTKDVSNGVRMGIFVAPPFFFYSFFMEVFNDGRSLGKMAMGLKVIRIDGRPPTVYDYAMRWMFRWVDIYMSWGAIAAMLISATPKGQRIGDLLADTTVIHTRNLRVPLKRILGLNNLASYTPKYPQAHLLTESQVLLAKETLHRSMKIKNAAHSAALENVAARISSLLKIDQPKNVQMFVQTVIKDYISLTR